MADYGMGRISQNSQNFPRSAKFRKIRKIPEDPAARKINLAGEEALLGAKPGESN